MIQIQRNLEPIEKIIEFCDQLNIKHKHESGSDAVKLSFKSQLFVTDSVYVRVRGLCFGLTIIQFSSAGTLFPENLSMTDVLALLMVQNGKSQRGFWGIEPNPKGLMLCLYHNATLESMDITEFECNVSFVQDMQVEYVTLFDVL